MDKLVDKADLDETIDVAALFSRLLAHRWGIFACVVASGIIFSAVALLMTPVYRATIVLVASDLDQDDSVLNFTSSALGGLASGLGLGPHDTRTEEALAVLRSREFTEDFITDEKLLPQLFPRAWSVQTGTWRVSEKKRPALAKAYKYFDEKIRTVVEDRKTGLITMQIDWTNRADAARWANELVRRLNDEMRGRAIAEADASLEYLNRELSQATTVEGRDAVGRLMEAQVKQRMLAHVTSDYALRVVDKAIATDDAEPIRPNKPLLFALGPVVGLLLGVVVFSAFGTSTANPRNGRDGRE